MSQTEWWWLALGLFALVVVVVAVLLGSIIAAARSIDRHAESIWTVGKQIAGNTVSIWMLEQTNRNLERVLGVATDLDRSVAGMSETLSALASSGGRRGR